MENFVPDYLQHQFNLYDRSPKTNIVHSCNYAEKVLSIDNQANCFLCTCDAWLPVSVGNIMDFDTLQSVWQSERANSLKEDLDNKKFTYCSVDYCGIRDNNMHMPKSWIGINIDESCNLRCPSCRSSPINFTSGDIYENKLRWSNHISRLLSEYEEPCTINMSGNGDPFASMIYRPLILKTKPLPNHEYRFMTNGLLLKKLLPKTSIFPVIHEYNISVDAGNKQTYEKVRLGGKWEILTDNIKWLTENVDQRIYINFVVQKDNWQSLLDFEQWISGLGINGRLTRLEDWATFDFTKNNVLDEKHPEYHDCMNTLKKLSYNKLIFQNSLDKMLDNYSG